MRTKACSFLSLGIMAAAAVALCTLPSGGQDVFFQAPVEPPVPAAPAAVPGAPGPRIVGVAAEAGGAVFGVTGAPGPQIVVTPVPPGELPPPGGFALFVENPQAEGVDEESRQLHEDDQAHERSTRQLVEQLQSAESAGDRSGLLEKLSQTVEEHFVIRQQIRAKELEALEARVKKLRELHDKREDAKAEIVRRRVEQLVRETEGLGWSGGGEHAVFEPGSPLGGPTPPRAINFGSRR